MTRRRERGEGSLSWSESRQRWIGRVSVGYRPDGKRRIVTVSAKTKTEARDKLRRMVRDHAEDVVEDRRVTVADVVNDWLDTELVGLAESTQENRRLLAENHIVPSLGARKLVQLRPREIDAWLHSKVAVLSRDTVERLLSILRRSIRRAQANDLVKRNVAELCRVPQGFDARPSKSLSVEEAARLLAACVEDSFGPYIVVSLLTGARTEELRALRWSEVDLDGDADSGVPPSVALVRSVRVGERMKTGSSYRRLELPAEAIDALRRQKKQQAEWRLRAESWPADHVFTTRVGTPLDAANVRRSFRRVAAAAGLEATKWTPREMRHSFVSLLSHAGVSIEEIAHLIGHAGTRTTEAVYRKELRPVLRRAAPAMDALFDVPENAVGKQIGKQVG